jgi:hypothetical protein
VQFSILSLKCVAINEDGTGGTTGPKNIAG